MALNKFMHPRNIYKNPPDFAQLAKRYEEFSDIAKTDISGRVSIDFKDPHALRVLTRCLLKSDFNLDVRIPEDRLVPTLPLRLNYILWIEDLLNVTAPTDSIWGIDIGTGACSVYPLLGAVKNKWHMIGTESDNESIKNAAENIKNNSLEDLIQLRKNSSSTTLEHLFNEEYSHVFHFTMCNPPFYTNLQELWESRSPARPPPKNGFTGSPQELITEGGELQFCRQMIEESKNLRDKILIFTTMVGHKYNLKELLIDLKAEGIKYTTTEFCQGRITRWGLAWTFQEYDFSKIESLKDKPRKKIVPITFSLKKLDSIDHMDKIIEKMKQILQDLKITYKTINKRRTEIILDLLASTNTWSNQRRKRRLQNRVNEDCTNAKIAKIDTELTSNVAETSSKSLDDSKIEVNTHNEGQQNSNDNKVNDLQKSELLQTSNNEICKPVVHAVMTICFKGEDILIEAEYLDGSGGKEGVHQIVQYIKNNWK